MDKYAGFDFESLKKAGENKKGFTFGGFKQAQGIGEGPDLEVKPGDWVQVKPELDIAHAGEIGKVEKMVRIPSGLGWKVYFPRGGSLTGANRSSVYSDKYLTKVPEDQLPPEYKEDMGGGFDGTRRFGMITVISQGAGDGWEGDKDSPHYKAGACGAILESIRTKLFQVQYGVGSLQPEVLEQNIKSALEDLDRVMQIVKSFESPRNTDAMPLSDPEPKPYSGSYKQPLKPPSMLG